MTADNKGKKLLITLIAVFSLLLGACYHGSGTAVSTPPLNTDKTQALIPTETDPDQDGPAADLSRSGNLHYHNFVLCLEDSLIYNSIDGQLSRYYHDTEQSVKLSDDSASQLSSDGQTLFYNQGRISGPLIKIDLDGSNQVRISQIQLKYLFEYQERLYGIDLATHQPVSLRTDGSDRQVLSELMATSLILDDQNMLYVTYANARDGVWQHNLETDTQTRIISRAVTSLNVVDEWLYFSDVLMKNNVFAWSLTENRGWPISTFSLDQPFIVSDGWLYGVLAEEQNRLMRWPVDGRRSLSREKPQLVIDDAVADFVICGSYIYYQRPDSERIYQASLAGGLPLRIT